MTKSSKLNFFYWWCLGISGLVVVGLGLYGVIREKNKQTTIPIPQTQKEALTLKEEEQFLEKYLQEMEKQLQEEQAKRAKEKESIDKQTKVIQAKLTSINQEIKTLSDQIKVLEEELTDSNLNETTKKEKEEQLTTLKAQKEVKIKEGQEWQAKIPALYSQQESNTKQLEWLTYQHSNLQKQGYLEKKSKTLEEAAIAYNQANKARIKVLLIQNSNNKTTFDQLKAYDLFLDNQLITFSRQLAEIKKELSARRLNQPWNPQKKKVTFEDVYGMEAEKEELSDLITYLKADYPSLVNFDQIKPRGYLLYGVPGTGKSFLIKALCEETGAYYLEVDPSRFDKTYVGEGNEELEKIWKEAEEHEKCIIFMDEISGLANRENRGDNKVAVNIVNNLLLKLDGFKSSENKIILMAATNHLEQVDTALKNRFSKIIKIDLIQDEEIEGFLKHQLRNYQISYHTFNHLKDIADRCKGKGYSNRDLTKFLDNAYQKTYKYKVQNPLHSVMLPSDLDEVLDREQGIKKSLAQIKEHRLTCEQEYQNWLKGLKTHLPKKKDMTEVSKTFYFSSLNWPGHDEPSLILPFVKQPFKKWKTDYGQYAFSGATFSQAVRGSILKLYIKYMRYAKKPLENAGLVIKDRNIS